MTPSRRRRPRLLGPEPRAQLRRARRAHAGSATPRPRRARASSPPRYPQRRARPTDFDELLDDPELDAVVDRDAGADALPARASGARGGQARARREAAGDAARPRPRSSSRSPRQRDLVLMPGHLLLYHPAVAEAEGADRRGRARRRALRLRQPPEPRHDPHRRERPLVARRPRPLGDPATCSTRSPSEALAHGNAFLTPGVEDVVFCYLRFPSGKIAHMHLSWLDPHKMRKLTVVGTREDGRLRRHGARAQGHDLRQGARGSPPRPTASGRPTPATSSSRRSRATSRCGSSAGTSSRSSRARATQRRSRKTGSRSSARSSSYRPRWSRPPHDRDRRDGDRLPGDGGRRGLQDPRLRRRRQAADALAAVDRETRRAAAARARRRDDRLDRRGRVRRDDGRRARDRRRPGLRARALHDRRRRRDRPRLARRERHLGRRADEDPGARLHHRLLDCSRRTSSSRPA